MEQRQSNFILTSELEPTLNPVLRAYINQDEYLDASSVEPPSVYLQALDLYADSTQEERNNRPVTGWADRQDPFDMVSSWPVAALSHAQIAEAREQFVQIITGNY